MLAVYLEAPFAAFRNFTAGWYRPSAGFIPPTAAYGVLLNFAGIDSRLREEEPDHSSKVPASLLRKGLPPCRLAIGAIVDHRSKHDKTEPQEAGCFPAVQTIYQQLHNYPVGTSGGDREKSAHGNKYNITPVRRELLVGLKAVLVIEANAEFENRIRKGCLGETDQTHYGIPFVGDNSFMIDRFDLLPRIPSAFWFERVLPDQQGEVFRTSRLTIHIDREDSSKTRSELFAPCSTASPLIPASAWVSFGEDSWN